MQADKTKHIYKNGLIVTKLGMTRMVTKAGEFVPVTLLKVEDQKVTKLLTKEKDGYQAYQVGYFPKPEHRVNKPDLGRMRKASIDQNFTRFKEFRLAQESAALEMGSVITAKMLEGIKAVDVTGLTKGRGFQGAIKRWGAKMGRETHGSMYHRRPGSLGQRSTPGKVYKNKHMPGHYGDEQNTIQNLDIMDIDLENNVVAVRGSVPGHRNAYLVVRPSVKL